MVAVALSSSADQQQQQPHSISTNLTSLLQCRVPIVCAPMAGAAGGLLASAVHQGGGFGFIAGGHRPPAHLLQEIAICRNDLGLAEDDPLPVGIGLIACRLESATSEQADLFISTVVAARPAAVWLSFGLEIHRWILDLQSRRSDTDFKIFVMVSTVEAALEAASWGVVDVVVAQGIESGGHGSETALPLLSLLPLIQRAFSSITSPPILLGAGGIATGSQLVAILPFADGAVLGTSFLTTPEALYSADQKALLVRSTETTRTTAFDHCRPSDTFPPGVDGRAISNTTVEDANSTGLTEELRAKYVRAVQESDLSRIVTWSGTSIGLVDGIIPASELVRNIEREAVEAIRRTSRFLV